MPEDIDAYDGDKVILCQLEVHAEDRIWFEDPPRTFRPYDWLRLAAMAFGAWAVVGFAAWGIARIVIKALG